MQQKIIVQFKKTCPEGQIPFYSRSGDAGMDLTSVTKEIHGDYLEYGTGIAVAIPEGYVGLIFPRSSISKQELLLCNSVGVIDSGYRGEIKLRFKRVEMANVYYGVGKEFTHYVGGDYSVGDKIGQLIIMPYPKIVVEIVDELDSTERGEGGFGSSGK